MVDFTRRQVFGLPFAAALNAQNARYPFIAYRDYSRCFPNFLRDLAARSYRKRNGEIAKLTTPDAIRARQRWVRETFWRLVGGLPERTPLNARAAGSFERDGYRVEKVVYESQPGFPIPANLYVPTKSKPPFPGVLFQMGHSANGKAAETYQKCCQGLARLGFLVLAFDPIGQGERIAYPDGKGASRMGSPTREHTHAGRAMLLTGDTVARLMTWDAVRSLDYLAAHPLVDPKRLASTGQSGGATLTMLLAAVDERLAAAAVSSGNTENYACANFNPPGSADDAEQDLVFAGPEGFDRWDLLYPMAPKPLLVLVSAKDFFHTYSPRYIENGWEEFQKLKKIYTVMGKANQLVWDDEPLPHSLGYYLRLRVYQFLVQWLMPGAPPVTEEPPVAIEDDATLAVSPPPCPTPFAVNRSAAAKIGTPEKPARIPELLRIPRFPVTSKVVGTRPANGCDTVAMDAASAPQVWVPSYVFVPKKIDNSRPALILLEVGARNSRSGDEGLAQMLARDGVLVVTPDLSGLGDLAGEYPRGAANSARGRSEEEDWAWGCLMLGRTLLGQRTADVLATVEAVRQQGYARGRRIVLAARGKLTVPALFAAALEPSISSLYLAGGLVSFRSLVEMEDYNHPFANFVPGALARVDLPQLTRSLAPRTVTMAGAVDASGKRIQADTVRQSYGAAHIEVRAEAAWDFATLKAL